MEQENQWADAEFCAWVTAYHTQKSTDVAGEFVLPDYFGDIRRVLCLRTQTHADGWYQNGKNLQYEGVVQFSILYIAGDDRVQNATFSLDFSDSVAWEENDESEQVLLVNPCVMQSACRVLSARKISLKAKVSTEILQRKKQCVAPRILGANGENDEACIAYLPAECQAMDFRAACVRDLGFGYEMECEANLPPVGEICFSELQLRFDDCHLQPDGIVCSGTAFLQCLYRTQGSEEQPQYENIARTFPVSVTVPDQDFGENFTYRAIPCVRTQKTEVAENAYGEARLLTVSAEYDLYLEAAQNHTVRVMRDAYSTACEADLSHVTMATPQLVGVYHTNLTVNEGKPRTEVGAEGAVAVTMLTADPKVLKSEYDAATQKLTLEGEVAVGALLSSGEGASFSDASYRLPFRMELVGIKTDGNPEFRYDCRVLSAKGRLDADTLYANIELGADIMVSAVFDETLLESVTLQTDAPYEKDDALTVYYPAANEDLWEIAKQYHVKKEALCLQNHLSPDACTAANPLLIPRN